MSTLKSWNIAPILIVGAVLGTYGRFDRLWLNKTIRKIVRYVLITY